MQLTINPEYAELVPTLSKEDYNSLYKSIKENGLWVTILTNPEGVILDGHHRYNICIALGIEPRFAIRTFENNLLEKKFVIECNLHRRHLLDYQKGLLAKELLKIEQEEANLKQKKAGEEFGKGIDNSLPNSMGKLYCKYCYKTVETTAGDGILECLECGSGLELLVDRHDKTAMSKTAKKVGLKSGEQLRRILKIDKNAPEELKEKVRKGQTSINYAYKTINRQEKKANKDPLPKGEFDVILADPPWKYDINTRGSPDDHYDVMEDNDIYNMKIPSSNNCVLFMWGTAPKLPEALKVIEAWGFTYKTNMVWIKDKIGTGYYFRGKHELLLVAVKGNPLIPEEKDRPESVLVAPRTIHSKKPEQVYSIIERMYPNCKYLELFARNTRKGWTAWGNEIIA